MATITYKPQVSDDPSFVTWAGLRLEANKATEIPERRGFPIEKASQNPWFEVQADEDEDPEEEDLLQRAEILGMKTDSRWSVKTLRAHVEDAERATSGSQPIAERDVVAKLAEPDPRAPAPKTPKPEPKVPGAQKGIA